MQGRNQVRFCSCGTRLAGDNRGSLCSACQNKSRNTLLSAPSVPPEFWLTHEMQKAISGRHMGNIIYAYRTHPIHGRVIAQATVARWASMSQTQLSRIESGPPLRDLDRLMQWAHTLRIPSRLLWFRMDDPDERIGSTGDNPVRENTEEVNLTLRRNFVTLSGLAVAGHVTGQLQSELDLIHIALDRGTTSEERTSHLEGTANDLGVQVVKIAPMAVLGPALKTLHSVRGLLGERQPTRQQARLVQTSSKLSIVVGEIMFNMGQFQKAHEWYKAAEHAAYDVGDRYLMDIALAGQSYLPTYSDDPRGVLALLEPRLNSNPSASPAIAWLWGFKARAHAELDEPDNFKRAIECAEVCLERSSPELVAPGIFSFLPEKLAFYEATSAVRLNDSDRAVKAADNALALYDLSETTEPTLAKLERARALAAAGEIPEACRVAKEALLDPATFHGITVRDFAQKFDNAIRSIQSPEARDWREVRAEVHDRKSLNTGNEEGLWTRRVKFSKNM